ncbi:hypothetical protein COX84_06355 [Candidatus Micrarchaeota archaeon CG_4_10_14_0_2_um_filter_49_7]|nr:MAG: hypothetical protein AUJ13_05355 [Candidatus Micrarchaeota archaeon CG1_02_49_24]PIZ92910.1 MAG: hypothetical protein COX84_06355 [Candidatus Micrarchaeota archaeon CG_4_10_14_0_2_um_filter_49_7]HII53656.1 hypothetical protein [Candidatus Micrarchaeota archaeon]
MAETGKTPAGTGTESQLPQESRSERIKTIIKELNRQIVHVLSGIAILFLLWNFGRDWLIIFLIAFTVFGLCFLYLRRFATLSIAEDFLGLMERSRFDMGPLYYAAGLLFAASLISSTNALSAVIVILALGDGFSTMVGKVFGKHRLPYNKGKSVEGFVAFFVTAILPAYIFIGWIAVPLAVIAAFLESIEIGIDDNLVITVPLVIVIDLLK